MRDSFDTAIAGSLTSIAPRQGFAAELLAALRASSVVPLHEVRYQRAAAGHWMKAVTATSIAATAGALIVIIRKVIGLRRSA